MTVEWSSFDVGKDGSVVFEQPGRNAVALNRIHGGPSAIEGRITANGQVWFVNPAGMVFGRNAQVDVGSLVASTAGISNADFMAGGSVFDVPGKPGASIVNDGTIRTAQAGYAVLAGERVENRGFIEAELGTVVLAGVKSYALDFHGDRLLRFEVKGAVGEGEGALVTNTGTVSSRGGRVLMTAAAARNVVDNVINTSGIVEARSAQVVNGEIVLLADGGGVEVSGALDASGRGERQKGGDIDVHGTKVVLAASAVLDASGNAGGGRIEVGRRPNGKTATETSLEKGSRVTADSLAFGSGGQVEIWSSTKTAVAGAISARGGPRGGDGGLIETSSRGEVFVAPTAVVVADAPKGFAGKWLLDPRDVIVSSKGTGSALSGGVFTPQSDNAAVSVEAIVAALDAGTQVTISTGASGGQAGNITVAAPIVLTGRQPAALSLSAAGTVEVQEKIESIGAPLDVTIEAPSISLRNNVFLNGGTFSAAMGNGATFVQAPRADLSAGIINVSAGSGSHLEINGEISLHDAKVATPSARFAVASGSFTLGNDAKITIFGSGDLSITADRLNLSGAAKSIRGTNGTITLEPSQSSTDLGLGSAGGVFAIKQEGLDRIVGFDLLRIGRLFDGSGGGGATVDGVLSFGRATTISTGGSVAVRPGAVLSVGEGTLELASSETTIVERGAKVTAGALSLVGREVRFAGMFDPSGGAPTSLTVGTAGANGRIEIAAPIKARSAPLSIRLLGKDGTAIDVGADVSVGDGMIVASIENGGSFVQRAGTSLSAPSVQIVGSDGVSVQLDGLVQSEDMRVLSSDGAVTLGATGEIGGRSLTIQGRSVELAGTIRAVRLDVTATRSLVASGTLVTTGGDLMLDASTGEQISVANATLRARNSGVDESIDGAATVSGAVTVTGSSITAGTGREVVVRGGNAATEPGRLVIEVPRYVLSPILSSELPASIDAEEPIAPANPSAQGSSSEAAQYASVFEGEEGGASRAPTPLRNSTATAQPAPSPSRRARQLDAPPLPVVSPMIGSILEEVKRSTFSSPAGTPGLGRNAVTGSGRNMP